MIEKLPFIYPEIALFITTCVVMVLGLSPKLEVRRLTAFVAAFGLVVAGMLAVNTEAPDGWILPQMMSFVKATVAGVGLLLVLLVAGVVDRDEETRIARGARFNPLRTNRAEFYAFFLFSLTGVMLCASADDLIWLFLALELTSLPTYIMVTMSTRGTKSQEAGVKYFFLGALGAATFLYGFALLYGATGTTHLFNTPGWSGTTIAGVFARDGISTLALAGMLLSIIGVSFKIAAVPMHFYTPDVYEGAAAPVSAFLAFVPKTAGFVTLITLCATMGWSFGPSGGSLPEYVRLVLWVMAAMTMTVGNVLAVLQHSVKRLLAYSSIAHSGYMLVGLIAGPSPGSPFASNGVAAVLFYLMAYGVMNVGAFAVIACLERDSVGGPEEVQNVEDLRGLCAKRPVLGWVMVICSLSLLGFPPLLGFFGKLPLFSSAISAGEIVLVVVLGLNSAIAAYYYLRLAAAPLLFELEPGMDRVRLVPFAGRPIAAVCSAAGVILLAVLANALMLASGEAGTYRPASSFAERQPDEAPVALQHDAD